jgi:tetratricopeptide (TPR) repeat protein
VRAEANKILAAPIAQGDATLRIHALALLGVIDLNINTEAAQADWNEVLAIAKKTGDQKWQNRAQGELGLVAGVKGDMGTAAFALYSAIGRADQIGDSAAHINFATWLSNGMAMHGMADKSLKLLDQTAELAKKSGYTTLPLQLSIAKIRALTHLPEPQSEESRELVRKLIAATLAQAQNENVLGAQSDLLSESGQFASSRGDLAGAEKAFRQAAKIATAAALPREEGEAYLRLSQFYRATNQPSKAALAIDHGISAVQRVEEAYDLPLFIAEKAEVQAALGEVSASDSSFQRATDLVDGLLVNAPSSQVKSNMIGALSQIYLGHFNLAWKRMHDAGYAFSIIESARGRALLDSIRYAKESASPLASPSREAIEIARLQRSLMHDRLTNAQTRQVLEELDAAYIRISPAEYAKQRLEMGLVRKKPVTVPELQSQLQPRQALIEFVLEEKESYAIEISRAGMKIHNLPGRSQIGDLARSFVTAIRSGSDSRSFGERLYQQLIKPVADPGVSSLIIVPDGPLHLIPFGALVPEGGGYLNSRLNFEAAPSATIYYALRRAPKERLHQSRSSALPLAHRRRMAAELSPRLAASATCGQVA